MANKLEFSLEDKAEVMLVNDKATQRQRSQSVLETVALLLTKQVHSMGMFLDLDTCHVFCSLQLINQ